MVPSMGESNYHNTMKSILLLRLSLVSVLLLLGAGCAAAAPVTPSEQTNSAPVVQVPAVTPVDPYEGWGTIMPGGVVSLRIPPGCYGDPGAGNIYVVCPTPGNDTPTPDMHLSSDGIQVNISRWENQDWDQWDKVVASLRVLVPLDRKIQINIEK
jgi:hypothetical protein